MNMQEAYEAGLAGSPQTRQLRQLLEPLGELPDSGAVADYLRARGITGDRSELASCPIANFIREECGFDNIAVTTTHASVCDENHSEVGYYAFSGIISIFIRRFDMCQFPDLITARSK